MGQTQTRSYDEVLTSEKIEKLRSELSELREAGRAQRQRFNDELYEVESELYAVRMKLLKRGEESKSLWNFWDYAKEVNQTIHSNPSKRGTPSQPAVTTPPSESRALVAPWYFFNIHSLFEAMLLRRLHIAMILQGQRDAQSSSWNGVIVHMYNVIPGIRESKKKTQEDFTITKEEIQKNIIHARESYENQLKLQKELVHFMVEEAKKGLVKKQPIDRRSMRSMGSASTASTLPGMIAHQEKKSPGGTSPTDDTSDASSLTSSDTSSSDDSSSSSSLGPDLR